MAILIPNLCHLIAMKCALTRCVYGSADHEQGPCPVHDLGFGSEEKPFQAALLFNDPSDWYQDLQLFTDIVLSGKVILGTPMRLNQTKIIVCTAGNCMKRLHLTFFDDFTPILCKDFPKSVAEESGCWPKGFGNRIPIRNQT